MPFLAQTTPDDDEEECDPFAHEDQCQHVKDNEECEELLGGDEGLVNYGVFYFCTMEKLKGLAVPIMVSVEWH